MENSGSSLIGPRTIGDRNRASLIGALYDHGPTSRADLARILQSTRSTVTAIVQPLIGQGVLTETPVDASLSAATKSTGKPGTPIWFAEDGPTLIGIHLVPQRVVLAQLRIDGSILRTRRFELPADSSAREFVQRILRVEVKKFIQNLDGVLGIGVSVGGVVDTSTGQILYVARAPYFDGLEVKQILEGSIGKNVIVDHHPRAQTLGDRWFGDGRNRSSFITVYVSDALGVGMYLNGTLHSGAAGSGGEYGHTFFLNHNAKTRCDCGLRGCLELSTNFDKFIERAKEAYPSLDMNRLSDLMRVSKKNSALRVVIDEYTDTLATAIANLEKLLAVNLYLIHGELTKLGSDYAAYLAKSVSQYLLHSTDSEFEIHFAGSGEDFSVLGAASLVLAQSLHFPV